MRKGIRCQRKGDGPLHGIRGGIRATHPRSRPWCRLYLATSESVMRKDRNSWARLMKPMRRAAGRQEEELTSRDSSPSMAVQRDDLPRDMGGPEHEGGAGWWAGGRNTGSNAGAGCGCESRGAVDWTRRERGRSQSRRGTRGREWPSRCGVAGVMVTLADGRTGETEARSAGWASWAGLGTKTELTMMLTMDIPTRHAEALWCVRLRLSRCDRRAIGRRHQRVQASAEALPILGSGAHHPCYCSAPVCC